MTIRFLVLVVLAGLLFAAATTAKEVTGQADLVLLADPVLGGIVRKLNATQTKLDEAVTKVSAHDERLKNHEDTWVRRDHVQQLANIAAHHNSRFNKDGKGKPFDPSLHRTSSRSSRVSDWGIRWRSSPTLPRSSSRLTAIASRPWPASRCSLEREG